jgi:hypothetical protein
MTTFSFSEASSDDDDGNKGDDVSNGDKKDEEEKKDKGESSSESSVSKSNEPQEVLEQVKAEVLVTEDSKEEKKVRRSRRGAK